MCSACKRTSERFMEPDQVTLFYRFGVALVIGLMVGLQREYAFRRRIEGGDIEGQEELFAGARTFPLMALLGCSAALLADTFEAPFVFGAVVLVLGFLLTIAHYQQVQDGDTGLTTEVAALVTVCIGALCYWNYLEVAAALGVGTVVLLALKVQTHSLARNIESEDVYATLKFAVITLVVLPVLPQESYGPPPFDVLVPYNVWLMVVFISGISFLGYVLIKVVGARRGVGLTGILGGLASSTAVTLTFTQRSRNARTLAQSFALAILLAWAIMYIRVLVEVAAINPDLLRVVWLPVTVALSVGLLYCGYLYYAQDIQQDEETDTFQNPFELGPAITFGVLYAIILVVAHAARTYLGDAGVYLSSVASGLADVDAITLSMARLSQGEGGIDLRTAARAVVLAAAANTLLKGGLVLAAGSKELRRAILPGFVLMVVTAVLVVFFI